MCDDLPAGILARELGEHRLADLQRAERVYQLLAAAHYAEGLALLRGSDARNERAACLEGLVAVAWAGGDPARAARLCGAAAAARLPDTTITPVSLAGCAEVVAATCAALGEEQFAAAWAAGQALTLEQAIAEALKDGAVSLRLS